MCLPSSIVLMITDCFAISTSTSNTSPSELCSFIFGMMHSVGSWNHNMKRVFYSVTTLGKYTQSFHLNGLFFQLSLGKTFGRLLQQDMYRPDALLTANQCCLSTHWRQQLYKNLKFWCLHKRWNDSEHRAQACSLMGVHWTSGVQGQGP